MCGFIAGSIRESVLAGREPRVSILADTLVLSSVFFFKIVRNLLERSSNSSPHLKYKEVYAPFSHVQHMFVQLTVEAPMGPTRRFWDW